MPEDIQTWIDGHLAARSRAYESRGAVATSVGSRWPRTTGGDVIAIAAIVDTAVRNYATPGLLNRWSDVLSRVARFALVAPRETHRDNAAFWSTFDPSSSTSTIWASRLPHL